MSTIDRLLTATKELKEICHEIGESGYVEPSFLVSNVPRELFDEIPAISRTDDEDPNEPMWEKRYRGVLYTCWQAPVVKL